MILAILTRIGVILAIVLVIAGATWKIVELRNTNSELSDAVEKATFAYAQLAADYKVVSGEVDRLKRMEDKRLAETKEIKKEVLNVVRTNSCVSSDSVKRSLDGLRNRPKPGTTDQP